jgi:hypothetical protein
MRTKTRDSAPKIQRFKRLNMKKYMFGLLLGLAGCLGTETMSDPSPDSESDDSVYENSDGEYLPPSSNQNAACMPYIEVLSVPFSDDKIVVHIASECSSPLFEDPGYPLPDILPRPISQEAL